MLSGWSQNKVIFTETTKGMEHLLYTIKGMSRLLKVKPHVVVPGVTLTHYFPSDLDAKMKQWKLFSSSSANPGKSEAFSKLESWLCNLDVDPAAGLSFVDKLSWCENPPPQQNASTAGRNSTTNTPLYTLSWCFVFSLQFRLQTQRDLPTDPLV